MEKRGERRAVTRSREGRGKKEGADRKKTDSNRTKV